MGTNEVKKYIYDYLIDKLIENFPRYFQLMERVDYEIFWGQLSDLISDKIYVTIVDKRISKVGKRYEEYLKNGKYYRRRTKKMFVNFEVYVQASEDFYHKADFATVEVIEFIESLFTETQETFNFFLQKGIVIKELEASDIRDFSKINIKTQEFRKEIEIPFEYEEIFEYIPEFGNDLETDINVL